MMHFSHHRSIIKLLGVKVVQSGALPPALPLYIFVGALTVSVQGDGERSMLCWGNLNVAGPDLHQRRKKNILVSELQHSARARSETTACSPVCCFYSLQYIHLKSASSSSNLKTIRGENSERRTFHEWNTKSLWAQAQPSASLEGMALIWAPRVLTEKPFSTSLPLSVTCTHQDKPSGGQYKLEMSLPFRSGQQRTRTYLVVFYWEERSKTFGRALPLVCLGQQTRSYTKSRHEKTLSMKQSPTELTFDRGWNLPELRKVNIEMGEKHVLHRVLSRAAGKDLRGNQEDHIYICKMSYLQHDTVLLTEENPTTLTK